MQKVLFNEIREWKGYNSTNLPYINTHPFFMPLLIDKDEDKINVYSSLYAVLGDGSIWAIIYPLFNLIVLFLPILFFNVYIAFLIFIVCWIAIVCLRWFLFNNIGVSKIVDFLSMRFVKKAYLWNSIISGIFVAFMFYILYITSLNIADMAIFFSTLIIMSIFKRRYNRYVLVMILGVFVILVNLLVMIV